MAVISDSYWEHEFGRRAAAIGEPIAINGMPVTIVGVSPRGFDGATVGQRAEIVTTVAAVPRLWPGLAEITQPGNFWLRILARPAAGLSANAAEARLNSVWPALSGELLSERWPAARKQSHGELAIRVRARGDRVEPTCATSMSSRWWCS